MNFPSLPLSNAKVIKIVCYHPPSVKAYGVTLISLTQRCQDVLLRIVE